MKAVILAGGLGTRIAEETTVRPKPMVEIGGRPIIWHILKTYTAYGISDFVICLGYRGYVIKEYFANYALHMSDVTFDMKTGRMTTHQVNAEPWSITLVETGDVTATGGRLKRVRDYLGDDAFCLTYGDGLSNVNIKALTAFHKSHGRIATVTAVQPLGRFGALDLDGDQVQQFVEKPPGSGWINAGYFVFSPKIIDYVDADASSLEIDVLSKVVQEGQLMAFKHEGFWQAMDTLRDRNQLEAEWNGGHARWKIW